MTEKLIPTDPRWIEVCTARRLLDCAQITASVYAKTDGHLTECDRYGLAAGQPSAHGVEGETHCTCVMGALRGTIAFVNRAAAILAGVAALPEEIRAESEGHPS